MGPWLWLRLESGVGLWDWAGVADEGMVLGLGVMRVDKGLGWTGGGHGA